MDSTLASQQPRQIARAGTRAMKLTICGSFGFGNAGDEAIPYAILDMATNFGVSIELDMVGRFENPALTDVIGIGSVDSWRRELLRGQPVVMSGGGIIENNPHAAIFRCERLLDSAFAARTCLYGISVEPGVAYGWRCKWRLSQALKRFEKVFTRDYLSETTLNELLPRIKTETIGDIVLWLRPDANALPERFRLPEKYMAVNLAPRWSKEASWRAWISGELHALCRELGLALVFVPMTGSYDDDRDEHRRTAAEIALMTPKVEVHVVESLLSPRAIASILADAELVVSMRLHGCVMAYAQKTTCVGLAYHPKLSGFFGTIGWEEALVPRLLPKRQGDGSYGYRFSDLGLGRRQLVRTVVACLSRSNFSRLPELKARSSAVLMRFLAELDNVDQKR